MEGAYGTLSLWTTYTNGIVSKNFEVLNSNNQVLIIRKDRKKVLSEAIFNGNMFIRALLNPEINLEVLKTPGVLKFWEKKQINTCSGWTGW